MPVQPGEEFAVHGAHFAPEQDLLLTVDGLGVEETITADESGAFGRSLAVPFDALPGGYTVSVAYAGGSVTQDFVVSEPGDTEPGDTEPALEIREMVPGRRYLLSGSGFAPPGLVRIELDDERSEVDWWKITDGIGNFTLELSIPDGVPTEGLIIRVWHNGNLWEFPLNASAPAATSAGPPR